MRLPGEIVSKGKESRRESRPEGFQHLEIRYLKIKQDRLKAIAREVKGKAKGFGIRDISEMDVSRIKKLSTL